jgi:hypothetical protein
MLVSGLALPPVAAQVATSNGQQSAGRAGQSTGSQAPTTRRDLHRGNDRDFLQRRHRPEQRRLWIERRVWIERRIRIERWSPQQHVGHTTLFGFPARQRIVQLTISSDG